jgi:formylglycine-generating enzyme required for sulfatase activity
MSRIAARPVAFVALLPLCAALAIPPGPGRSAPARVVRKPATNSIGMELALVPAGVFTMGSPPQEHLQFDQEGPQHQVAITRTFLMSVHPVTQAEYTKIMGTNPSWFSPTGGGKDKVKGLDTSNFPVERVSWHDARAFCAKLSAREAEIKAGRKYRLPTEAEWERACRAGTTTPYSFGTSLSSKQANFNGLRPHGGAATGPYLGRTCKVGSYLPNAWRLHDMHGNVWQWCQDWYKADYYTHSPKEDPQGPNSGPGRVLRGGAWDYNGWNCRSACRIFGYPAGRDYNSGFRVVCAAPRAR